MRIALVIERFDPTGGGAERSTTQIACELARRGHEVTVLAGRARPGAEPAGVHVRAWSQGWMRTAWQLWGFSRWARRQLAVGGYDVSLAMSTVVPAMVVQPRGGMVRETHRRNIAMRRRAGSRALKRLTLGFAPKHQLHLWLERRTLRDPRVRRIVAVSRYVVDQIRRHYGIDEARVELIPNAAVMPAMSDAERAAARQRVRAGFGIPDDAVAYLFAAHNPRLKGVAPLLHATRRLAARHERVVVMLAGLIGYAQQHQAAHLGIRAHVRIIGPTNRMADLYCAADVTVLPTYYDPCSKVVIESLMMGTPAITTAFNGAADFVLPPGGPVRGRVIADPADVRALAQAMEDLLDDGERARCRAACAGLADELSMKRHVDRLEQVLKDAARQAAQGCEGGRG